nr:unnamed protein product [Callosobruchus analis]
MSGKATWYTPIASIKNKEEAWQRIDRKGWVAPKMDLEPEISYFNNNFKYERLPEYDLYFSYTKVFPLWDERKSKDNRRYLPDIWENIYEQEKDKPVPAITSMTYGRPCRPPYDYVDATYRKVNARTDFYRRRGVMRVKERQAV